MVANYYEEVLISAVSQIPIEKALSFESFDGDELRLADAALDPEFEGMWEEYYLKGHQRPNDWVARWPLIKSLNNSFFEIMLAVSPAEPDLGPVALRAEVASTIGCKKPDPDAWLNTPLPELKESERIVDMLREAVVRACEAQGEAAKTAMCRGWVALERSVHVLRVTKRDLQMSRNCLFGTHAVGGLDPNSVLGRLNRGERGESLAAVRQCGPEDDPGTSNNATIAVDRQLVTDHPPAKPRVSNEPLQEAPPSGPLGVFMLALALAAVLFVSLESRIAGVLVALVIAVALLAVVNNRNS